MRFLLIPLLLLPLAAPALAQMKYILQYEDQFSKWHRYQEKQQGKWVVNHGMLQTPGVLLRIPAPQLLST